MSFIDWITKPDTIKGLFGLALTFASFYYTWLLVTTPAKREREEISRREAQHSTADTSKIPLTGSKFEVLPKDVIQPGYTKMERGNT